VGFHIREVLAGLKLEAFAKVSGSKGLQLYVPLNTAVTYDATKAFAKAIATLLERQHRDLVVSQMAKTLRRNKVFIDWSQNDDKKTTVGPYSLRAKREEPYVSLPVTWDELKKQQRDPDALFFSPADALKRIAKQGDLFAPVLRLKQTLPPEFIGPAPKASRPPSRALVTYAEKRDFAKTAEPAPVLPSRSRQGSRRRFVVQKHAASHLHYDFRLEMHDTLKSWAVPKGLPYEPGVRRSAFATEDHPLEYLDFEGTIPEGQYGGGTVMVWDLGTYDIVAGNYWKGDLTVFLSGKKLNGEWHVYRKSHDGEKSVWTLEKTGDAMKPLSPRREDQSVLTQRTMAEIAEANDAQWQSSRASAKTEKRARVGETPGAQATPPEKVKTPRATKADRRARAAKLPEFVEPMAARQVAELRDEDGWIYEIKWDGYRALGRKDGENSRLISRNNKDLSRDFPAVTTALKALDADSALIDGEIVALDADGRPSFQSLQHRATSTAAIVFYAYDLLNLDGEDWRERSLLQRKERLATLIGALGPSSPIKFSAGLEGRLAEIIEQVQRLGLEGIVAKRLAAPYKSGERTGDWLKLKFDPEQEFVIGGFKPGRPVESLVVGTYEGAKLICAGKVRQGLNPQWRAELGRLLRPLETEACPFANLPNSHKSHWGEGITADQMKELRWVKPKVVAQIAFTEWTRGGNLRHGTFKGLRPDKAAKDVVREGAGGSGVQTA
jgi:bifunctional non-homologous end joining protein LigD